MENKEKTQRTHTTRDKKNTDKNQHPTCVERNRGGSSAKEGGAEEDLRGLGRGLKNRDIPKGIGEGEGAGLREGRSTEIRGGTNILARKTLPRGLLITHHLGGKIPSCPFYLGVDNICRHGTVDVIFGSKYDSLP